MRIGFRKIARFCFKSSVKCNMIWKFSDTMSVITSTMSVTMGWEVDGMGAGREVNGSAGDICADELLVCCDEVVEGN
jgi:hypothetical protein